MLQNYIIKTIRTNLILLNTRLLGLIPRRNTFGSIAKQSLGRRSFQRMSGETVSKTSILARWNTVEYARNIWEICKNGPSFVSKSSSISGKTDVFRNFLVCKKTGGQEAVSSSLATRTSKIPETARFRGFFVLFSMKFRVSPSSRSESCKIFKNVQRSLLRSIMRRRGRCVSLPEKKERYSRCEVNSVAISFLLHFVIESAFLRGNSALLGKK